MTRSSSPRFRPGVWPVALFGVALCCAPAAQAEKADREKHIEFQLAGGGYGTFGGRLLCLEFSRCEVPLLDRLYDFHSFEVIPRLGALTAGSGPRYQDPRRQPMNVPAVMGGIVPPWLQGGINQPDSGRTLATGHSSQYS